MTTIGSYEAKTHFSQLLERTGRGEEFLITKHGTPVATLSPHPADRKKDIPELIRRMEEFGKDRSLDGLTIREMIEEGRR